MATLAKLSSFKIYEVGVLTKLSQTNQNLVNNYHLAKLIDYCPALDYFSSILVLLILVLLNSRTKIIVINDFVLFIGVLTQWYSRPGNKYLFGFTLTTAL